MFCSHNNCLYNFTFFNRSGWGCFFNCHSDNITYICITTTGPTLYTNDKCFTGTRVVRNEYSRFLLDHLFSVLLTQCVLSQSLSLNGTVLKQKVVLSQ